MIRLSPGLFNAQLRLMGQSMLWRKALLCPCRDLYSGGARQDCPICTGRGVTWAVGIPSRAGVVGAKAVRRQADFSAWEDGDIALSVPSDTPLWGAGEKDRVVLLDSEESFSVILTHNGAARIDFTPTRITRCYWTRGSEATFRDADAPKCDAGTGILSWGAGKVAPDAGIQFCLQGFRRPDYQLVTMIPVGRGHFGGLPLPKLLHCRATSLILK